MMKRCRRHAVVAALFFIGPAFASSEPGSAGSLPEAALVIIVSRTSTGLQTGNGFVAGDGTLVVTCAHMVYEDSPGGQHRMEAFPGVYSPYLGEASDARILAADEELDLAVLEVTWKGHPALSVADANTVISARRGRVIGLSAAVRRVGNWDAGSPEVESFWVDTEERPLAYVGVRRHEPRLVVLDGYGQLGHGWSGSPILLPGTSTAIGCFGKLRKEGPFGPRGMRETAQGPAVCQVPRLLGTGPGDRRFHPAPSCLNGPEDAHAACRLALHVAGSPPGRYSSAVELARAFLQHRPNSAFGHRMLAYASERLERGEAAREEYRRALELDPNGLYVQLLYAQFLGNHGEPNAAQRILEPLWQSGRSHDLVALALVNLLGKQKEYTRCLEILEEVVQNHGRNAYLWQQMAACRLALQETEAAIAPVTRFVELCPERGPFRADLARLLEKTGALDEAEQHFRKLLEVEPENPTVYLWLAEFLARHRPQAGKEALQYAEKALGLPPRADLPKEDIEERIRKMREQMLSTGEK
jgi:Flp pilus assembly protein TadD